MHPYSHPSSLVTLAAPPEGIHRQRKSEHYRQPRRQTTKHLPPLPSSSSPPSVQHITSSEKLTFPYTSSSLQHATSSEKLNFPSMSSEKATISFSASSSPSLQHTVSSSPTLQHTTSSEKVSSNGAFPDYTGLIVHEVQEHISKWNSLPHIAIFSEVDKLVAQGTSAIFQTLHPLNIPNVVSWLLVFIASHTEQQQAIRRELYKAGVVEGCTDYERMRSLPVLESCIHETARMISSSKKSVTYDPLNHRHVSTSMFASDKWSPTAVSKRIPLTLDLGENTQFAMMLIKVITITILHKYFLFLQGTFPIVHNKEPYYLPTPTSPAILRVHSHARDGWYLQDCGTYIFYNFFHEISVKPRVGTLLPSAFLLKATFDALKAPEMLDNFMYDLQDQVGLNQTVWGVKWEIPTRAHKWEFYFYGVPWSKNRSQDSHLVPYSDCPNRSLPNVHSLLTHRFGVQETLPEYDPERMVLFSCDILRGKKDNQEVVLKGEGYHLYYSDSPLRSPLKAHSVHLKPDASILYENDFTGWCKDAGGYGELVRELKKMVIEVFGEDAWNGENEWLVDGWQDSAQVAIAHKAPSPSRPRSIAVYYFGFASYDKFVNLINTWKMPTYLGEQIAAHKAMLEHLIIEFGCDMIVDPVTRKPTTIKVGIFGSV